MTKPRQSHPPMQQIVGEKCRLTGIGAVLAQRLAPGVDDLLRSLGSEADTLGLPLYAVGGFVRDLLLGKSTLDLDLVVEGDALAFARRLVQRRGGTCVEFQRFRTATVVLPALGKIDIATARWEHYPRPAALPEVGPGSIGYDLYRRDFTINSMAVRLNSEGYGELLDPFGGRADLENGRVRVLHDGSFLDDPTRILRAVRFEQRFGFRIECRTRRLLQRNAVRSVLRLVSPQRLRNELVLMAREPGVGEGFRRLNDLGVLAAIYPGLSLSQPRRRMLIRLEKHLKWYHSLGLSEPLEDWVVYFQVLLVGLRAERRRAAARRLALHRRVTVVADQVARRAARVLSRMSAAPDLRASTLYFLLAPLRLESVLVLMAMTQSKRAVAALSGYITSFRSQRPAVSGRDLAALGLPPGPSHGWILRRVLAAQLDGRASTRHEQLALAARLIRRGP